MGKFFKTAKRRTPEMDRAIGEKGLVDAIQSYKGTTSVAPDSLGFYKGETVDKILKENIRRLNSESPVNLGGISKQPDRVSWRLKNIARTISNPKLEGAFKYDLETPNIRSSDKTLSHLGIKSSLRSWVPDHTYVKYMQNLRSKIRDAKKLHIANNKNTKRSRVDQVAGGE